MIYELAYERVSNRNLLIEEELIDQAIEKARLNKKELYHSFYLYDEEVKQHFNNYKTIASFRGIVKLKHLIFDIDKQKDTDDFVLLRTRDFVKTLQDEWGLYEEEISVWFSGRGYHIEIPEYFDFGIGEHVVGDVKHTINEYFPNVDSSLYDYNHLIRAPYSLNAKSNLYKIPLTHKELFQLSYEQIHDLARTNDIRKLDIYDSEIDYEQRKEELKWHSKIVHDKVMRQAIIDKNEPTAIVTCMQNLWNRGAIEGKRHIELLRLTSAFRRQGVPKDAIVMLLLHWANTMSEYETKRVVDQVFKKGYVYGCDDHVMSANCDPKCIFYKNKNYTVSVNNTNELESELVERMINNNLVNIDLARFFQLHKSYKVYEGEVVILIAETKLGKSTLFQNIAVSYPELSWLYLALENGKLLDIQRLVQLSNDLSEEQLIDKYKRGETGLTNYIQHIQLVDDAMGIEDIRKVVIQTNAKIVVIDTLDQLTLKGDGYTAQTELAAKELKNLAKQLKIIIFAIHHVSKQSSKDGDLNAHSGKGSSSLEQKADKLLGMTGHQDDSMRRVFSILARNATPFDVTMHFNKQTFRFKRLG